MPQSMGVMSLPTVERLSVYLRTLKEALAEGKDYIVSTEIARRNGFTPAQVRKDLSCFGSFGVKGKGYDVKELIERLEEILGINRRWNVAIVGLGNIGKALVKYKGLKKTGFDVVAIFDIDPNLVGKTYRGIQVYHTDEIGKVAKKNDIQIAIVAVPKEAAKEAIKKVIDAGIKGILNFTEVRVPIPEGFFLKNVNLLGELESITYYMVNPDRVCRCYQPAKR
ncbi:redox-sensing transcriptional repressor Rex [bacterium]|nr:redox-sensing transcriptional repressor Rex [bacterium]